jgi:hypothetical protein
MWPLLVLLMAWSVAPLLASSQPADDAALAEFSAAVDAYVALHRQLEGPIPTIASSDDPDEIRRAIEALGAKIRGRRSTARRGDIFTPAVARVIHARIHAGCGGDVDAVHSSAHDEAPPLSRPVVNGHWPGSAMTFMPPSVLCQLPTLPEELEYRFVNRDLVLWDAHADVIVDVMRGALTRAKRTACPGVSATPVERRRAP